MQETAVMDWTTQCVRFRWTTEFVKDAIDAAIARQFLLSLEGNVETFLLVAALLVVFWIRRYRGKHGDDIVPTAATKTTLHQFQHQQQQGHHQHHQSAMTSMMEVSIVEPPSDASFRMKNKLKKNPAIPPPDTMNRPRFDTLGSILDFGANNFTTTNRSRTTTSGGTNSNVFASAFLQQQQRQRLGSRGGFEDDDVDDEMNNYPKLDSNNPNHGGNNNDSFAKDWMLRHAQYHGPLQHRLVYQTWTPPTSWTQASRDVLPRDPHVPLERSVQLCVASHVSTIDIHPPKPNNSNKQQASDASYHGSVATTTSTTTTSACASGIHKNKIDSTKNKKKNNKKPLFLEPSLILPVADVSVHVQHAAGGVLDIYVKESTREEWMEHTFQSAAAAAQFQTDVLAIQLFGQDLHCMYQALQLVHQGSMACRGKEYVVHDMGLPDHHKKEIAEKKGDSELNGNNDSDTDDVCLVQGIAWDDVMRCLGACFPSIRFKLETLLWMHHHGGTAATAAATNTSGKGRKQNGSKSNLKDNHPSSTTTTTAAAAVHVQDPHERGLMSSADTFSLTEDYLRKRLLLGPIDFFRLFVSTLPETALPQTSSSRARVEQLMRWNKRVARASVLVQAYARARVVLNRGWQLHRPLPEKYWKRRIAFDEGIDNLQWDAAAENEYYEGTVSRDIICQVRGLDSLNKQQWWRMGTADQSVPMLSLMQGYSLIGVHTFRVVDLDDTPFRPGRDPVRVIPSLREMIEANPELDFFISGFCMSHTQTYTISVYVRSLPKGIDPSFDTVVDNFTNGNAQLRDQKLEILVQLGVHRNAMTWTTWLIVTFLSIVLRISFSGDALPPKQTVSSGDRTPLPAVRLSKCGDQYHFGGALQPENSGLPKNYVAHVLYVDLRRQSLIGVRLFFLHLTEGGLRRKILDLTVILAGHSPEELPERALATIRYVHPNPKEFALSTSYIASKMKKEVDSVTPALTVNEGVFARGFRILVTDPFAAVVSPVFRAREVPSHRNTEAQVDERVSRNELIRIKNYAQVVVTLDEFERAVNELIGILENVVVPMRKDQIDCMDTAQVTQALEEIPSSSQVSTFHEGDLAKVPILSRVDRGEILRHFIAAGCSHKGAVVRLVESASWRGLTFPLDTRVCRLELQNGQFFQQGVDKRGFPVFYFRNMCLGPWRRDDDAVIAAVLHRLETSLEILERKRPFVRCTVVVLMGKPHKRKKKKIKETKGTEDTGQNEQDKEEKNDDRDDDEAEDDFPDSDGEIVYEEGLEWDEEMLGLANNPRIDSKEQWQVHTSMNVVHRLINLLVDYYPERLHRAYVVVGHGNKAYARTVLGGMVHLSKYIPTSRTRDKVKFLHRYSDLQDYIDKDELVSICSGRAPLRPEVFDCA